MDRDFFFYEMNDLTSLVVLNNMKRIFSVFTIFAVVAFSTEMFAQSIGVIRGKVTDAVTNDPVPFANVVLQGEIKGTTTDFDGVFDLAQVPTGLHNVQFSFVGYDAITIFEVEVTPSRPAVISVVMKP